MTSQAGVHVMYVNIHEHDVNMFWLKDSFTTESESYWLFATRPSLLGLGIR